MAEPVDLYLSYDNSDAGVVEQLATSLADAGLNVWLDRWEIAPGDEWEPATNAALREATAVGVCVGRHESVAHQLAAIRAVPPDRKGEGPALIPMLLPGTDTRELAAGLVSTQVVDFSGGIDEDAVV